MFHLNQKTSVEVKTGKFGHYLQVKRCGEYDRWINIGKASWIKLTTMIGDIDFALNNRSELAYDLYKTKQNSQKVLVTFYNGEPFVGVHLFDEKEECCRGKGMNLTTTEWQKLKGLMNDINAAMTSMIFPQDWLYPETPVSFYRALVKTFKGETKHIDKWSNTCPEIQKPKPGCYFMVQEQERILPKATDLLAMCLLLLCEPVCQVPGQV